MVSAEQITDLNKEFNSINLDGSGTIRRADIGAALKILGYDLPGYELRQRLVRYGDKSELTFEELTNLYIEINAEKTAHIKSWKNKIGGVHAAYRVQGIAEHGADSIVHTIRLEEEVAFANWINRNLEDDKDLKRHLPILLEGGDLYKKIDDGIILCKLINVAQPNTVDERGINKKSLNTYMKLENLLLSLTSAQAIGCNVVNIDADDLSKGKPHLVLGIIWQIIRHGLFKDINLEHVPGMFHLLREGETLDQLRQMAHEEILIRWVNYHMANAGINRRIANFSGDISDSVVYTHLLHQIAPSDANVTLNPLTKDDLMRRASSMLTEAAKIDCNSFIIPHDVVQGTPKLNLAFVANLFNKYPALPEPTTEEVPEEELVEETREEKMYRNWMNSLGVKPYVNHLYVSMQNGIIIFQLYDYIRHGVVDWGKVATKFRKLQNMMDQIQNCNYAILVGKEFGFSLVGIQGKDIYDQNRTLTLALVWQVMRAYTLEILKSCTDGATYATDKEIINWVNEKLQAAGKTSKLHNFQEANISNAIVVLDLIDAIQPGTIKYDIVYPGNTDKEKMDNAKYAITSARKLGAKIYALPEDIVEVKPKMVMTVFACLMARCYMPAFQPEGVANAVSNGN